MADNPRIEDLRRRIQKDPASIAFAQLAEEYRRAAQYQESVEACRAGLALHPGYLSARVTLGRSLLELGDLDSAQRELEAVLKSAPENLAAIRGIADIHHKRGALGPALEFYRTALGLARNDPELEQTVADLAQRLKPKHREDPKDGLSLEQMHREISLRVPAATSAPLADKPQRPAAAATPGRVVQPAQGTPDELQGKSSGGSHEKAPASTIRRPAPAPSLAIRMAPDASRVFPAQSEAAPHPSPAPDPARERGVRTVAALEQWLDAIHVTRASQTS